MFLSIVLVATTVGGYASGFEMDAPERELRDRLQAWELEDLGVGEIGHVYSSAYCIQDGRLNLNGNEPLIERPIFEIGHRVTLLPGLRATVEILPPITETQKLERSDLEFFARIPDCTILEASGSVVFIEVERVNGENRLSAFLDKYLEEALPMAPGDVGENRDSTTDSSTELPNEHNESWRVTEEVSRIDDSRKVVVFLSARNDVSTGTSFTRPRLILRCEENITVIYFKFGPYLGQDRTLVTIRIDKEPAEDIQMLISSDGRAFGFWEGGTAIPFIKKLFGKENIIVRVTSYWGHRDTAEFLIGGLEEEITPLREACNWASR